MAGMADEEPLRGRLVYSVRYVDAAGRRTVYIEDSRGRRRRIGYVRASEGRWFAERVDGLPVEGTYRTRAAAGDALIAARSLA